MEGTQLRYVIKFVADMDKAVKFYRDVVGLTLKFESPGWSEFVTGETTLALHPASEKNPAGKVELGFTVADVEAFYRDMSAKACSSACRQRSRISAGCWRSSSIPKAHIAALARRRHSSILKEVKNGKHNLYERPESQARPKGRHHGGRDARA
jgi:catechol 2,3-dioxygenase-like lactoylglutathione lyase family enzyme